MLVEKMLAQVERFQREILGAPIPSKPMMLIAGEVNAFIEHAEEELNELRSAKTTADQADALLDLAYITLGRLLRMGIVPGPAFEAVHEANMKRVRGSNRKRPGDTYDAVKPEGWQPPDLTPYLTATRDEVLQLFVTRQCKPLRDKAYHAQDAASRARDAQGYTSGYDHRLTAVAGGTCLASQPEIDAYRASLPKTVKHTAGKVPVDLIPWEFEEETGRVFGYGAWKYSKDGFKVSPPSYHELCAALKRHVGKFLAGQDLDLPPDNRPIEPMTDREYSGLHHVGHMGCCVAMLGWVIKNRPDRDDRWKGK